MGVGDASRWLVWLVCGRSRVAVGGWPSVGECARFGFLDGLGVFGGVMVVESDEVGDERAAARGGEGVGVNGAGAGGCA